MAYGIPNPVLFGRGIGFRSAMVTLEVRIRSLLVRLRNDSRAVAMTPGGTAQETVQLNIESLWSGGPFADPVRSSFIDEVAHPHFIYFLHSEL